MQENETGKPASVHPVVIWISVTDRFGRNRRVRGDLVQSIESVTIPAGDYFGPEIATYSVIHFVGGSKLPVKQRVEEIERRISEAR